MSSLSKPALFVTCSRPGLIRGGVSHPAIASHAPERFTEGQLREMLAEPAIAIVYGRRVLPEHLSDLLGVTLANRTRIEGGRIDTDAGASLATDQVAQQNDLRKEVQKTEQVAELHAEAETLNAAGVDRISTDTLPAGPRPAQTPAGAAVALEAEVAAIEGAGTHETLTDDAALRREAPAATTRRRGAIHHPV